LKKPTGSVRFYKPETEKTELNPNRKKPRKNRAKPEKTKSKPSKTEKTEPNRFEPVSIRFCFFFFK
jgi:hypothetical protein